MAITTFDTLKFARKLKDAGVPEGYAEALSDALDSHLATKQDVDRGKTELKDAINALRTELKEDISALRAELKEDINALRAEFNEDLNGVKAEIRNLKTEIAGDIKLLQWMMALVILVNVIPALKTLFS